MRSEMHRSQGDDSSEGWRRPTAHSEEWSRVTTVLLNRQIVFLDRLSADIRARNGAVVKRAEIIRALIDSLTESALDLSSIEGEEDLRRLLREQPGRQPVPIGSGE